MRWTSRSIARAASIFLATVWLSLTAGCGQNEKPPINTEFEVVVVAGSQWYAHAPVWIGIERRIFEKHGFSISWQFIDSSADRIEMIDLDEVDFASVGEIAMLTAMSSGDDSFYWVGSQLNAPGFEGIVGRPNIDELKDLKGKVVGLPFGSSVELTFRLLLRANDLDPDTDVKLYDLDSNSVHNAFRAGKLDAAAIWEPSLSRLQESAGANLLGSDTDTDLYDRFGTMTGPDVLIIRRAWVNADERRARAFLGAYFESVEWMAAHLDQAAAIVHRTYIVNDLDTIRENLERIEWYRQQEQPSVIAGDAGLFDQAESVVDLLYAEGKIDEKPEFRRWAYLDLVVTSATDP